MLRVYNYIKDNRSMSVSIFNAGLTFQIGLVALSIQMFGISPKSLLLVLTFFISAFTALVWHLLLAREKYNKTVVAMFLALDSILIIAVFFPLAYTSALYPLLFLSLIVGVRFLLDRKAGLKASILLLLFFVIAFIVYYANGIISNPLYHFSLSFFPAIIVNIISSFTLTVVSTVQKRYRQLESEKESLNKSCLSLKRELFLNSQLVNSLHKDVKRKNIEIKNILNLSGQLNISSDSKRAIESFLYTVIGQLGCKHALILTQTKQENNYYSIFSSKGIHTDDPKRIRIYLNSNLLNTLNASREPMLEQNIPKNDLYADEIKFLKYFSQDLFCPIMIKSKMAGILIVGEKISGAQFSKEDVNLISIVANQASFVMEQTLITNEFQDIYFKTIKAMMKSLEAKYVFARGHNTRTANYVNIIATKMGLGQSEVKELTYGTLLHDVGKIAIRDKYLLDTNVFAEDETVVKKKILEHTLKGGTILKSSGFDDKIVDLALHHHEDYNGNGFPHGLGEGDITLGVRILSVCNTYDAMTSDRPHRKALSELTAKEYLEYNSNKKFDPQVVKAFLSELSVNKEMQKFH